jgi:hypothetical protein
MSDFTPSQRASIIAQSRKLLSDDTPTSSPSSPPRTLPVDIEFEDPVERWKREGTESERQRAEAKAELRRQADDATSAGWATVGARLDDLEQRLAAVEQTVSALYEVAPAAAEFSNATVARLEELAACAQKAGLTFETVRALHERQVEHLRNRLAASDAAAARESAFLGRQLSEARREIDALKGKVDRERDRGETDEKLERIREAVDNVIEYQRRDPNVR